MYLYNTLKKSVQRTVSKVAMSFIERFHCTFTSELRTTSIIMNNFQGSNVSFIERFHCILPLN